MKQIVLSFIIFKFCLISSIAATGALDGNAGRTYVSSAGGSTAVKAEACETDASTADASVADNPINCHADFRTIFFPDNTCQFEDASWSGSHIVFREWNFDDAISGEKNISHQKNPVHHFSEPGVYNVSLKIVSQSNCRDSVSKPASVGGTFVTVIIHGRVENILNGEPITGQPVSINASSIQYSALKLTNTLGLYADTIPQVPLGIPIIISVLDCNDSLEAQTIYSSETPFEINFSICAPVPCKAGFTSYLDSANLVQNAFVFTDTSEGSPNHWLWTFGDGTESHDQNPVHSYRDPGQYTVCLTITKKSLSGEIICADSTCSVVVTPSYYNLGGLLFAGLYPINNPQNSGDTGVACLYRLHGNSLVPVDTVVFTYLGYYAFLHVVEGKYVVKAMLKKGSAHYDGFIPAYYGDQLKWQNAAFIDLSGGNSFNNDIHLYADSLVHGAGSIGGYVSSRDRGELVSDAEVILFNESLEAVSFNTSDETGRFSFAGVGYGKYWLYAEITGKYSQLREVNLSESEPVADGIVIEVSSVDFTGIGPSGQLDAGSVRVYPNPVTSDLHVRFTPSRTGNFILEISSLTGNLLSSVTSSGDQTERMVTLVCRDLPFGLYFLTIRSSDGMILATKKILKH